MYSEPMNNVTVPGLYHFHPIKFDQVP